tara:strand:- start:106 stop:408 length:303 start_codon:yes stop_codon:yes gene_type:complete
MATSHQSKKFRHKREVIKFIFDYKCLSCNKKDDNLEVHHNDRDNKNHSWINLIPLCNNCHKMTTKSNIKYYSHSDFMVDKLIEAVEGFPSKVSKEEVNPG